METISSFVNGTEFGQISFGCMSLHVVFNIFATDHEIVSQLNEKLNHQGQ